MTQDTNHNKLDALRQSENNIDSPEKNLVKSLVPNNTPSQGLEINTEQIENDHQVSQNVEEIQEYELKLNTELGLELPDGLSEDQQTYWLVLFTRLRTMYAKGYIDKNFIYDIFETFDGLDDKQKQIGLDNLYDFEQNKDKIIAGMEEVISIQDNQDIIKQTADLFSPELRTEFLYFIQNGKNIDDVVQEQLNAELSSNQDSLAYQRLQNYVGNTNDYKNGKVLTIEDLVGKFDLDDTARSTKTYETGSKPLQN